MYDPEWEVMMCGLCSRPRQGRETQVQSGADPNLTPRPPGHEGVTKETTPLMLHVSVVLSAEVDKPRELTLDTVLLSQWVHTWSEEHHSESWTCGFNLWLTHGIITSKHLNSNRQFTFKDLVFENRLRTLSQGIPGRAVAGVFRLHRSKSEAWSLLPAPTQQYAGPDELFHLWGVLGAQHTARHCVSSYSQLTPGRALAVSHLWEVKVLLRMQTLIQVICKALPELTVPACGRHPSGCSEAQSTWQWLTGKTHSSTLSVLHMSPLWLAAESRRRWSSEIRIQGMASDRFSANLSVPHTKGLQIY